MVGAKARIVTLDDHLKISFLSELIVVAVSCTVAVIPYVLCWFCFGSVFTLRSEAGDHVLCVYTDTFFLFFILHEDVKGA